MDVVLAHRGLGQAGPVEQHAGRDGAAQEGVGEHKAMHRSTAMLVRGTSVEADLGPGGRVRPVGER